MGKELEAIDWEGRGKNGEGRRVREEEEGRRRGKKGKGTGDEGNVDREDSVRRRGVIAMSMSVTRQG